MRSKAGVALRTRSLADHAYEVLRHRLIMLDITPGDPINEAALSTELEVGRTPIREALKRLERDHLVVSYPRRGTFATNVDLTDLSTISEMREALEPIAARRAARNLTPDRRQGFTAAISDLRALGSADDQRTLMERDLEVHRLIYSSVDNPHLSETLIRLDDLATASGASSSRAFHTSSPTSVSTSICSRRSSKAMRRRWPNWQLNTSAISTGLYAPLSVEFGSQSSKESNRRSVAT